MDPISVALLAALAGGAGGELGRQAWAGLTTLVRRPFTRGANPSVQSPAVSSGETELVRLREAPGDIARAQALSTALAVRAAMDPEFLPSLQQWHEQAKRVRTGDGGVHNNVTGGTQHGPVLQGRDYSGLSFTTSSPPPTAPDGETRSMHG
ncbi:hypothetical protein [Streptomyces sp. WAC04114]|uniref:hypothetical protein n=1 Tax=Streptomyces sp. WAC04114 TaxID=2867961 RepID=UPI001C8C6288|nr:hypothetical protein [Streptomyces sp. WAC04114]MBX9361799.1 hypothetical protein [Streptomyces sp. WAC04114]